MSAVGDGTIAAGVTVFGTIAVKVFDRWRARRPSKTSALDERRQLQDEWREYREAQDQRILGCEKEIRELRTELGRKDGEISSLRQEIERRDMRIAELERRVTNQEHRTE